MKIVAYLTVALLTTAFLSSCKKEDEASPEDKLKAEQFKAFILSKKFQVKEYYSDKPIDYVEDDAEVKSETELFNYVSVWIKDDWNVFDVNSGKVTITQNAHKIDGNDAETFVKDFNIGADKKGAFFNFLNYQYEPLKYRLVEFSGDSFLVYVDWHSGAKVFTRFQVLPE
jgi:hypothetical protein